MPRSEKLTFDGSQGGRLAGRLDLPDHEPAAYALFAHCFTCSKESSAAARISRGLTQHDFGVLRFDFTGLGGSEGEFANTNFSSNVDDLVLASAYLRETRQAPRLLIGHSLGGAAVLAAAARIPEVGGVVTIGAPFDPAHAAHLFQDLRDDIETTGECRIEISGRAFVIRRQFLDDISQHNLRPAITGLGRPLLVFHAPQDAVVGVDNARLLFEAAKHPKSFISLDTADHLLTSATDAAYVADVVSAWASRYLR